MKKPYMKPKLFAETFRMAEHVASNCAIGSGATVTFGHGSHCNYHDGNILLFYSSTSDCAGMDYDKEAYTEQEFLEEFLSEAHMGCYNAFINGRVFAS
ncbi:MAG: hypothetical protein IJH52_00050 [Oscillospiraceae bacterium]|nr:hypothetical protein [Oscillospiraceae bacterium]